MRSLLPPASAAEADPDRPPDDRVPPPDRPWVMLNMVASADGAAAVEGRSGGLGGPADRRMFRALRGHADVVLVAGGTARREGYGPVRLDPDIVVTRRGRGQRALPRLAVVSGSLDFDWSARLFTDSHEPPIVITGAGADEARRRRAARVAEVLIAGEERVDPARALSALGHTGARVVLCEGGPSLNGALLGAGLVDELNLSVSPLLAGGDAIRIVRGDPPDDPLELDLRRVLVEDGFLFLRYVRAAEAGEGARR